MGSLRFDGVNDNVTIASGITGNVGTQTYSYQVKGILNALPTVAGITGAFGFIGTTATGQANGVCVYSTGAVNIVSGNTPRYGTGAGFLSVGVPFDFTISHISTGEWTITDNVTTTTVASGTFTISTSWSGSLNNIGRLNSSTAHYLNADIELVEVTGHTNARTWDANLSGGTGSTLPTTVDTNQGTLVNFPTNDSQWVGFGGAGAALDTNLLNSSVVTSVLSTEIQLACSVQAVSTTTSTLSTGILLFSSGVGFSSITAELTDSSSGLAGGIHSTSSMSASLSTSIRFSATCSSSSTMLGTLYEPPPDVEDTLQNKKLILLQDAGDAYPDNTINDAMDTYLEVRYSVDQGLSDMIARYLGE